MSNVRVIYQKNGKVNTHVLPRDSLKLFCQDKLVLKVEPVKSNEKFQLKLASNKEVLELFSQLEIILAANIPFLDAIEIVSTTLKSPRLKSLCSDIKHTVKNGHSLDSAFENHSYIDPIIVAFFKIASDKGNLGVMVASLYRILKLRSDNRHQILGKLSYPAIVLVAFTIALVVIFNMVIPQFEMMFNQYGLVLPLYTTLLLSIKNFFVNYGVFIISFTSLLIFSIVYLYRTRNSMRLFIDEVMVHKIPFFSKLYLSSQLYNFFIALNLLLQANYHFSEALEHAKLLLKNSYLLDTIQKIHDSIKTGNSIYDAFKASGLFNEVVLNLIHSGERSASLLLCIDKIETIYAHDFKKRIQGFSSSIEPIFFIVMMLTILWVMLAIFTPIWDMGNVINA